MTYGILRITRDARRVHSNKHILPERWQGQRQAKRRPKRQMRARMKRKSLGMCGTRRQLGQPRPARDGHVAKTHRESA